MRDCVGASLRGMRQRGRVAGGEGKGPGVRWGLVSLLAPLGVAFANYAATCSAPILTSLWVVWRDDLSMLSLGEAWPFHLRDHTVVL